MSAVIFSPAFPGSKRSLCLVAGPCWRETSCQFTPAGPPPVKLRTSDGLIDLVNACVAPVNRPTLSEQGRRPPPPVAPRERTGIPGRRTTRTRHRPSREKRSIAVRCTHSHVDCCRLPAGAGIKSQLQLVLLVSFRSDETLAVGRGSVKPYPAAARIRFPRRVRSDERSDE